MKILINYLNLIKEMSLKILCLHGYRQNGELMRKRIKQLLGNSIKYELICPTGTFDIDESMKGWWSLESKEAFLQKHKYIDYDNAVQNLMKQIDGIDIDYIIGFTQGAVFSTLLLGHNKLHVKGIILMSGSDIMDEELITFNMIKTPSLHFVGEKDELCPLIYSQKLVERYVTGKIVFHKHGHVIPTSKQSRDIILEFI